MKTEKYLVFMLFILLILSGCYSSDYVNKEKAKHPKIVNDTNFEDYVLKKIEHKDSEIFTMIPIDELLLSNRYSNKYYINLIYKKDIASSSIYLVFIHTGFDLLHLSKNEKSLFVNADSLDYAFVCHKTNRDEETFIYQCFTEYGFTVQEEKVYYEIDEAFLITMIESQQVTLKLEGMSQSISAELSSATAHYLYKFYHKVILYNKN